MTTHDKRYDQSQALIEASYLAGFAMIADAGDLDDAPIDAAFPAAIEPVHQLNPWYIGRQPARKRWAKEAIEAFARRLDEVSVRPRPLTSTALVVWKPEQGEKPATWLGSVAKAIGPKLALPFVRRETA
jgi:hypothetical protein